MLICLLRCHKMWGETAYQDYFTQQQPDNQASSQTSSEHAHRGGDAGQNRALASAAASKPNRFRWDPLCSPDTNTL